MIFFQIFIGNTDPDTIVTHMFDCPVSARFVRLEIKDYVGRPSLRMDIIGCPTNTGFDFIPSTRETRPSIFQLILWLVLFYRVNWLHWLLGLVGLHSYHRYLFVWIHEYYCHRAREICSHTGPSINGFDIWATLSRYYIEIFQFHERNCQQIWTMM